MRSIGNGSSVERIRVMIQCLGTDPELRHDLCHDFIKAPSTLVTICSVNPYRLRGCLGSQAYFCNLCLLQGIEHADDALIVHITGATNNNAGVGIAGFHCDQGRFERGQLYELVIERNAPSGVHLDAIYFWWRRG